MLEHFSSKMKIHSDGHSFAGRGNPVVKKIKIVHENRIIQALVFPQTIWMILLGDMNTNLIVQTNKHV